MSSYGVPAGVEAGGPPGVDVGAWLDPGVEAGGPAGVDVGAWLDPGVEAGGPAGVDVGAWLDPGVEVGGPAGVDVGAWLDPGVEAGDPLVTFPVASVPEPVDPVFAELELPGVTPAQNDATPAAPAAFSRFLNATLLVLRCPLLAR